MSWKAALLLAAVLPCTGQARASVFETWTRIGLQFTNLGRAEASATAAGLATVTTSSSTSAHLSTVTLSFNPDLSLNTTLTVTDPETAFDQVILSSIRARPDLSGGVFGNLSGAVANSNLGILPNSLPWTIGPKPRPPPPVVSIDHVASNIIIIIKPGVPPSPGGGGGGGGISGRPRLSALNVGGILTMAGTLSPTGPVRVSFVGAPWTVKSVSAVNRTANGGFDVFAENGFARGPASLTSSTAQTSGLLQLVSVTHVTTEFPGSAAADLSGIFTRTRIHFVPEPEMLILLGCGAASMALAGSRRMRG